MKFGMIQMKYVLSMIVHHWDFKLIGNPGRHLYKTTIVMENGLEIELSKRQPTH